LSIDQLNKAMDAGAEFGLSPSLNKTICEEAKRLGFPFIPGVMTPSEIEFAHELGHTVLKLFPAAQLGGASFLKAMLGPYEQLGIQFIPMGGVNINNIKEYVHLKNVIAVGGSWLVTKESMFTINYLGVYYNVLEALQSIKSVNRET
jgi:2-dehydro-3-deoxyphosphogluconate aldolase/(4S)-4-hydroxy-2-oxoglutarate aldolase